MKDLIARLKLVPHPEGGFYRETYRSEMTIPMSGLLPKFSGSRHFSTAILFLLPRGSKSLLHQIKSDEIWHFYLGGPLSLFEISPQGKTKKSVLGANLTQGEKVQHVVLADTWFGAIPEPEAEFSLVGCTVSPGFDFHDFTLGDKEKLLKQYPNASEIINLLAK